MKILSNGIQLIAAGVAAAACAFSVTGAEPAWPVFTVDGAVQTSTWISVGRVTSMQAVDCRYGSFGRVIRASFTVERPLVGRTEGEIVSVSVFDADGAFALRSGERYLVFFRPVESPCGTVSANAGFLHIENSSVATATIVNEPSVQDLDPFIDRVRVVIGNRKR